MTAGQVATLLAKDLRLGPRSPIVLWALVLPVLLTLLVRGVFGGLFAAEPRLGIVDQGGSALVAQARAVAGIDVRVLDDERELLAQLEANDLDAGLVLPVGFDAAVRAGQRPPLQLSVAGESLASDRIVIALTTLELARGLTGATSPVEVEVVTLGDDEVPFDLRLLPLLVIMAVAIAGGMIPAAGLVDEREKGTLAALLVTPTTIAHVFAAKAAFGWLLAVVAGVTTLALNGVLTVAPVTTLAAIGLGALLMAELGLVLGAWAPDTNTLFAAWKGGGLLLFFPVIFFIWPGLPTWIAHLGPTTYFLRPVYRASVEGAGLGDVWVDLLVAALWCLVLAPLVLVAGRRLEQRPARGSGSPAEARPAPSA